MYCKRCGNPIPDNAQFCDNCGLSTSAQAAKPTAAPPAEKSFNGAGCIIALVIVLLVMLLAFFCIRYLPSLLALTPQQNPTGNQGFFGPSESTEAATYPSITLPSIPDQSYEDLLTRYDNYILPGSDSSYKCYSDLVGMSPAEIILAQEEIYARHGATFGDSSIQEYFQARSWYTPATGNFTLNQYEECNLCLLQVYSAIQNETLYNTDNPYLNQCPWDYVLPESNIRNLRASDLQYLSKDQLTAGRNEIMARHGYIFSNEDLREYFYSKPWYKPSTPKEKFNTNVLSKTENQNIAMIQLYERRAKGVSFSSGNPYAGIYNANRLYLFPYSDTVKLTDADLSGWSKTELQLAYYEIYARRGFTFTDDYLLEYFLQFAWYAPDTLPGDASTIIFSQIEEYNLQLLQKGPTSSGNSGNTGSISNTNVPVIVSHDKYTYTLEKNGKVLYCYHIPYVPGAPESVNQKMYDRCYTSLQDDVFNQLENPRMIGMVYTVGRHQDIISVAVHHHDTYSLDWYSIYNFSASTGEMLTDAQVFAAFGLTEQQGRNLIREALTKYWDYEASRIPEDMRDAVCKATREKTLEDTNINNVKPYVGANGTLCFKGTIYSIAGAESYRHLFTASGVTFSNTCNVHR